MLPALARGIGDLRRRRLLEGWVEGLALHGQVALFAAGAAVLLARVVLRWESAEALPLLALAGASLATAFVRARRALPSERAAAAWLDVRAGAGGEIVTETELGSSAWSAVARARVEQSRRALPTVRVDRLLRALLPAALFAALALWVPVPRPAVGPPPLVTDAAVAALEQRLETLEETLDLPPETLEELEQRLERAREAAEAGDAASAFEAMDRLGERLEAQAERALDAAQRAEADLASAAADPSLAEAQAALDAALATLGAAGLARDVPEVVQAALVPGTLALPPGVQLDSAQLAALAGAMKGAVDGSLESLVAGRLLDPSRLRELQAGGAGSGLGELDPDHVCDEDCKKPGGT